MNVGVEPRVRIQMAVVLMRLRREAVRSSPFRDRVTAREGFDSGQVTDLAGQRPPPPSQRGPASGDGFAAQLRQHIRRQD